MIDTTTTRSSLVDQLDLSNDGPVMHGVNAATGARLEPDYLGVSREDLARVADTTHRAFRSYRKLSGMQRAAFLNSIADEIEAIAADLLERVHLETALPDTRICAEMQRTTGQLRYFAQIAATGRWKDPCISVGDPNRTPLPRPDLRSIRHPIGPVAIFCASNFPLAFSVAGGDTASALAAGCPVVVVAHESHPGTAELIGQAVMKAARDNQIPSGTFALIYGGGRNIGVPLIQHPRIRAVGFTGSRSGGMALIRAAHERPDPIPVFAEMSSLNPLLILPEALNERGEALAKGLSASVSMGMGQFCTKPGLILLPSGRAASRFADVLSHHLARAPVTPFLNQAIAYAYQEGLNQRAQLNVPSLKTWSTEDSPATLFFTNPATFNRYDILKDELFGPSTLIVTYGSRSELLEIIDGLEGQLTGSIHGAESDLADVGDIIDELELKVGRLVFNGYPTGVEISDAMVHGGPFPAVSDGRSTSVGYGAIERFTRPVCYQNLPDSLIPAELSEESWEH